MSLLLDTCCFAQFPVTIISVQWHIYFNIGMDVNICMKWCMWRIYLFISISCIIQIEKVSHLCILIRLRLLISDTDKHKCLSSKAFCSVTVWVLWIANNWWIGNCVFCSFGMLLHYKILYLPWVLPESKCWYLDYLGRFWGFYPAGMASSLHD